MPSLRIELDSDAPEAIDGRHIRAVAFQDVRLEYVRRTLDRLGRPDPQRALVVGSGRGLLARGLAAMGHQVTAVDPSPAATEIAAADAQSEDVEVDHRTAPAEDLRLGGQTFDLAFYADTFEVTSELDAVVAQASRALRTGGLLIYDTVNRTIPARLTYLAAFQTLPMTRIMPAGRYAADRLRTPEEMEEVLARHGLGGHEICPFTPASARGLASSVLRRRQGRITDDEIPPLVDFSLTPGKSPVVTYFGHAVKN
ncbi:methyltransferase domain-containing protein [Phytoactinopolyspora halotolerans]|uniref:Methyltransferase domain-containing protein n=2 Tax=Phytoactinopolyspora halotolerans TaxID=1981512 RepID=A0A6L9SE39_9ACTN|nr:methyltransferase domain-containing protein [Phytoactinopolyspora halotolerans]